MKILTIIILLIFPAAFYYTHNQSKEEISSFYAEAHSYNIDTISNRLKDMVSNIYVVSDNFLNKHRHELNAETMQQLRDMYLWKFSSISLFNLDEECINSTNKMNVGNKLPSLTTISDYSNKISTSSPYIVSINNNDVIYIDLLLNLEDKYLLFRLNSNQIQATMGPSIFTFVKDLKSGLLVYPNVQNLWSKYKKVEKDEKYLRKEYGSVREISPPITNLPPAIQEMVDTNNFTSDKYICTSLVINGFSWEVVQITIPQVNDYGILLVYGLCTAAILLLFYYMRNSKKQVDMIYRFMEGEYNKISINNANFSLVEQVNKLSSQLSEAQSELTDQIRKSEKEKNLLLLNQEQIKKEYIQSIYDPASLLYRSVLKIEDKVYTLYTKIEENSLRIILLYFIIRHLLGTKILEIDEEILSVENKNILDEFKEYLDKENFISIDPNLLTTEALEKILELFKSDIKYLSQFIQQDYIQINHRVQDVVSNINEVQAIVKDIKPFIATIFEKVHSIYSIVSKDIKIGRK